MTNPARRPKARRRPREPRGPAPPPHPQAQDHRAAAGPAFWGQSPAAPEADGDGAPEPPAPTQARLTGDPSALLRSLGEPPLGRNPAALHHLSIVYEEAVRTATALAAANGLLDMDELED